MKSKTFNTRVGYVCNNHGPTQFEVHNRSISAFYEIISRDSYRGTKITTFGPFEAPIEEYTDEDGQPAKRVNINWQIPEGYRPWHANVFSVREKATCMKK